MFEAIKGYFAKSPTGITVQTEDIAYAANALMQSGQFSQYNPDDLLTRKGYKIYKKMMTDEQVKAVVRFHRDAVTGRNWQFEDCPELEEEENEIRKQILTKVVQAVPGSFKTRLDMVMSSLYNGFSLVEKSFNLIEHEGKSWAGIKSLTLKPFDTFYFSLDDYGQLEKLEQQTGGYVVDLDLSKFIHHVCNPDVHEFYGQSELREAYRAWYSKDTTILLQNIYLERAAAGFVWATPKENHTLTTKSPEYQTLVNVLSNIRSNSAMILPSGIDLNIHSPTDTQAFDRAITAHDKAIAKALLMPNLLGLSEQGPNGSRALGETQLEAFLWMLDAEAKQLEETLNEQLFADIAKLNWPDGLFPRFCLKELSNKQKMEIIDKWVNLTGAQVVRKTQADEDHVRATLGFPEYEEDDEIEEPEPEEETEEPEEESEEEELEDPSEDEETLVGQARARVSAEMAKKKAIERVDFKVIEKKSDDLAVKHVDDLSKSIAEGVAKMLNPFYEKESVTPDDIKSLKFDGRSKTKINNRAKSMLTDGWMLGVKHAKDEVNKSKGATMSIDFARLDTNAAEYFDAKAFNMTGKLTGDMLSTAANILQNSIKDEKPIGDTVDEIYRTFASQGFITPEDAQAQMAGILGTQTEKATTARLNNVVRTNTFEAINEARYSYFTDFNLDDFVRALEYSAIMDSRTTQICQHLDGHIHDAKGEVWNAGFRPPNHYQCRSLLIPVTEFDHWEESPYPEIEPQEGFK